MPKRIPVKKANKTRKKTSTWKTIKSRRSTSHRLKLAVLAILGIITSAIVFGGFSVAQFLKAPLTQAAGSFPEGRVWDETTVMNLVLVATDDAGSTIEGLSILTADKYQNSVSVASLPVEKVVYYPLGLGKTSLSEAIKLGDYLSPKIGVGMVEKVLRKNLAIPIDRYAIVKASSLADWGVNPLSFKELLRIKNLPKFFSNARFIKDNVTTNLTLAEMADLLVFLRGVPPGNIYNKSFLTVGKEPVRQPADRDLSVTDFNNLDAWWSNFYTRGTFKTVRTPVLVLNGTNREGLGIWGGRFVSNIGGDLLTVTNAVSNYPHSILITNKPELPIVQALGRSLNILVVNRVGEGQTQGEYDSSRAEVTLVLGLDEASNL